MIDLLKTSTFPFAGRPAQLAVTDLRRPAPPARVARMQERMAVRGNVDTRLPYQVKNLSRELMIPYWQARTGKIGAKIKHHNYIMTLLTKLL